jgi:hypothetical protein
MDEMPFGLSFSGVGLMSEWGFAVASAFQSPACRSGFATRSQSAVKAGLMRG